MMGFLRLTGGYGQRGQVQKVLTYALKLGTYIHECMRKNFGSNYIWGQRSRSQMSNAQTSLIATKRIHIDHSWNRTMKFEDGRFVTDLRSRSKRSNIQNINVRK